MTRETVAHTMAELDMASLESFVTPADSATPDEEEGEEPEEDSAASDQSLLRDDKILTQIASLLSLILPREPLKIAFRGLHTDDPNLKGTSLEYLESVLPKKVKESLWPFLEDERPGQKTSKSREEILDELIQSNQSIQMSLQELREKRGEAD